MHKTLARDVMSTDVPVTHPAAPFKHLVALLRNRQTDAVVVIDQARRPLGIVTAADLIIKETDPQGYGPRAHDPYRGRDRKKATGAVAAEVMSAPPITAFPQTTVIEAAQGDAAACNCPATGYPADDRRPGRPHHTVRHPGCLPAA